MNQAIKLILSRKTLIVILRYFLGLVMMIYGLTKLMQTQFIVLPFSAWVKPLEDQSGALIAWSFLGYSVWFTILLGLLEFVPAMLLLFRKTYYLGALLMLPVLLNVFLINFALDLWSDTKVVSAILLLVNLLILLLEWKTVIKPIFLTIWNHQSPSHHPKRETLINVVLMVALIFFFGRIFFQYRHQSNFLTGDWFQKKNHIWTVENQGLEADSLGLSLIHRGDRLFFEPYDNLRIMDKEKTIHRSFQYQLKENEHTLTLLQKDSLLFTWHYSFESDTILLLKTDKDRENFQDVVLKKRILKAHLKK